MIFFINNFLLMHHFINNNKFIKYLQYILAVLVYLFSRQAMTDHLLLKFDQLNLSYRILNKNYK